MRARLSAALMAGRAAATLSRQLGRGGGTVIAGHLVPRLAPDALREVTHSLPNGSIVVSGTNGKTTTTRLLSHILLGAGLRPIHNRAGANLLSGLFSAVAQATDWQARPRGDIGLFEVDEATVPRALQHIQARVLLLHNIFRDQLDRYGEVHFVAGLWRDAASSLSAGSTLVLNADDPLVAALATQRTLTFGVDDPSVGDKVVPHAADARLCPRCGAALEYDVVFYGHLGHYACPTGDYARPRPSVVATQIELFGDEGSNLTITTPDGVIRAHLRLPGLYNVYNALAAVAVCCAIGVRRDVVARGLETFTAAFGRLERIQVEDRQLFLALVKNPVGFTEVLRTILAPPGRRTLVIAINDLLADGTDVSWLWDVEFERLADRVNVAICSGLRAEDMAVRLKYAGVEQSRIRVENDLQRALESSLRSAEPSETIYVLPTYTAMLAMREILQRNGYVRGFWED